MKRAILVKLGGSLITEKDRPGTARPDLISRLAGELSDAWPDLEMGLVLGHGSGSFGHVAARAWGLAGGNATAPEEVAGGASRTQAKAAELHAIVMTALRQAGLPAFSIAPGSAAVSSSGAAVSFQVEPVALALSRSMLPVTYGDVVLDRVRGAAILSTETVLAELASGLPGHGWQVDRAIWLGETDGIYGADGKPVPRVDPVTSAAVRSAVGGSPATDVTGGMAHRLEIALRLAEAGIPSWIGDGSRPGALALALRGEEVGGSRVLPDPD